jgi:hypothetical protein
MKIQGKQLADQLRDEDTPFTALYATEYRDGALTFKAKNASGGSIAQGVPVAINGVSGDIPTVIPADASTSAMPAFGLTATSSSNNADVQIITFGNLSSVATNTFSAGSTLYVDAGGGLSATAPTGSGSKIQNIGRVVRSHTDSGVIKVGGAGRTNATPNLDEGHFFVGDANNQSIESAYQLPLTAGSNGQVLTSNGTNVTFQDASGASAPTSLTASVSVGDFTPTHWITDPSNSTIFTINLPTTRYEMTQAFSNDGETFIIENPSKAVVTLRISDAQQYINSVYYQSFIRHEGDYDDQGVGTGEPLTYNIQPLTNVKVHIKKEYEVDGTPYSFNINRIVYHVVVGGL